MGSRPKPLLLDHLDGELGAKIVSLLQKDTDRAVAAKRAKKAERAEKAKRQEKAAKAEGESEAP